MNFSYHIQVCTMFAFYITFTARHRAVKWQITHLSRYKLYLDCTISRHPLGNPYRINADTMIIAVFIDHGEHHTVPAFYVYIFGGKFPLIFYSDDRNIPCRAGRRAGLGSFWYQKLPIYHTTT